LFINEIIVVAREDELGEYDTFKSVYGLGKLKKVVVTGNNGSGDKYITTKRYNAKGRIISWECDDPYDD